MRLFIAAFPPRDVAAHLHQQVRQLRISEVARSGRSVGLTTRQRWHLTLVFLGEVPDDRAPDVAAALDLAVPRWRSTIADPPTLRLAGGGQFGSGPATVLWVGVTGAVEPLARLSAALRAELRAGDLPFDNRPFRPHLTLARVGQRLDPTKLAADLTTLGGYRGPEWTVAAVDVVVGRPSGQDYERLATRRTDR